MPRITSATYYHQCFHRNSHQLDFSKLQCQRRTEKTISSIGASSTFKTGANPTVKVGFNIPNGVIANLFDNTIIVLYRKTYSINVSGGEVTSSLYRLLCHFYRDERFYFYHYDDTFDLVIFKETSWPIIAAKIPQINQIANDPNEPRFQFQFLAFENLQPAPINRIIELASELMIKSCHSNNLGTLITYTKKVSD